MFEMVTDDTLRSTVPYGTAAFPFAYYLDELGKCKGQCVEWHWHQEFEFTCVLSGPVCCRVGAEQIRLNAGDGLFLNSGAIHRFESQAGGVLCDLLFLPELFAPAGSAVASQYISPLRRASSQYFVFRREDEARRPLLDRLEALRLQAQSPHPTKELQLSILAAQLWQAFFPQVQGALTPDTGGVSRLAQSRLHQMLELIHSQYQQPLTLEQIGAAAHVGKSEALRCFHRGIQTTPMAYLNEYRLDRARELLLTTADPVSTVAWRVGFQSPGYFCRVFRQRYGLSPGAFRRRAQDQPEG